MQQIKSGDALTRHFVTCTLHRIVAGLLKRRYGLQSLKCQRQHFRTEINLYFCSEMDDEVEIRIFHFLECTLRFIAKTLDSGLDQLLVLLNDIFCDQHNFYINCSGSGVCEDIADLSDGAGIEVYDDGMLLQVFVGLCDAFHVLKCAEHILK